MKSSPAKPFLFRFDGKIPALKNGKRHVWEEDAEGHWHPKVYSSKEVMSWYNNQRAPLGRQMALQSYLDPILDTSIRVYCRLELYAKNALSSLDVDNVYTTVQELLQAPSKPESKRKHKGFLAVIQNDKQVRGYSTWTYPIEDIRGAYLWVWEIQPEYGDDLEMLHLFQTYRKRNLDDLKKVSGRGLKLPPTFFQTTT